MPGFSPVGTRPVDSFGASSITAGKVIFRAANVVANQLFMTAGHLLFGGAVPMVITPPRVTWLGVETLHPGSASARITWGGVEVLRTTLTTLSTLDQVTWIGAEALHVGVAADRVTWVGTEALHPGAAANHVTWMGVEVLHGLINSVADRGFVNLIC